MIKQPRPVRAWGIFYNGRISPRTYADRYAAEYYGGFARVIPVEIRPVPKAKARKK